MPVVGPFTGEFGDEILCWIPYCRSIFGDDFTAISRGKTDSWYPGPVINAYELLTLEEWTTLLNERVSKYGRMKQFELDALDRLILERAGLKTDLPPHRMYGHNGLPWVKGRLQLPGTPQRFKPHPKREGLPERYTAIRFYKNDWYDTKKAMRVKTDLPIVGLRCRTPADNHEEVDLWADMLVEYEPLDSFDVCSQVISHAENFHCNYGSFPFLSLSYGIPTTAYKEWSSTAWHSKLEAKLARAMGTTLEIVKIGPVY